MATKAEFIEQKNYIEAEIDRLYAQLKLIKDALSEIEAKEKTEAIATVGKQYGVLLFVGREFIVTPAIHQYAKGRGFCEGYYSAWLVGQKAKILSIDPYSDNYQIRAECDTGHTYRLGIGINEEQRNERVKFLSADTPFPVELIAEALLHGNS